jgi:Ala-tRNA(Pro) deacylase
MKLRDYLDHQGASYKVLHHDPVFSSQDLAAAEHVPGMQVIKPVVVRADGQYVMCVLPASRRIDLTELRDELHAEDVRLAEEQTLQLLFPECELGAEPPIGCLFGLPTVMDDSLQQDATVTFQAGTHQEAVTMPLGEFCRVAHPDIAHFARPN